MEEKGGKFFQKSMFRKKKKAYSKIFTEKEKEKKPQR